MNMQRCRLNFVLVLYMPSTPCLPPPLWEQSAAERLSERFQPCLVLAETD